MKFTMNSQRVTTISAIFVAMFVLYGFFYFYSQEQLLKTITSTKLAGIQANYQREEATQTARLNARADAICGTIAKLCSIQLENSQTFNLLKEGLATTLEPFMDYSEIAAIEVRDKNNRGYISMWRKDGEIKFRTDYLLPAEYRRNYSLQVKKPALSRGEQQGLVTVFVDEQLLVQTTARFKAELKTSADLEEASLRSHFRRTILPQVSALLGAILFIVISGRVVGSSYRMIETQRQELVGFNLELEQRVKERTGELERVHRQLVDASRQAGKAEVATGVLHNVGNVLNSVNVSSSVIADTIRKLRIANLGKVADLLDEHQPDLAEFMTTDSRAAMLPSFLRQLASHFTAEQETAVKEIELLQRNVDHIKEIVNAQQAHASTAGFVESLDLCELLETTLRMNADSFRRHKITIVRKFQKIPPIPADKHKVMQILVNLLSNARQAMEDSPEKVLTLEVQATAQQTVRITIRDTGCGVPAESLTRIFSHGFTTKAEGHGFGLHSSSLAAREMKGALTVQSAGPGNGASFSLELPVAPPPPGAA